MGRMNSRASVRQSRDSNYNFKRPESQWGESQNGDDEPNLKRQNSNMSMQSKVSGRSRRSNTSKKSVVVAAAASTSSKKKGKGKAPSEMSNLKKDG